jgi:hypothetical protein
MKEPVNLSVVASGFLSTVIVASGFHLRQGYGGQVSRKDA